MDTINAAKNGSPEAIAEILGTFKFPDTSNDDRAQVARIALWESLDSAPTDSAEGFTRHANRAVALALMDAEEHAWNTGLEFQRTTSQLEALYAAQKAGDRSDYTRQRVTRLEAVQAALMGFPGALAN